MNASAEKTRVEAPASLGASARLELPITGMTCANCASTIERTLRRKVPGVLSANVNLATERATVEYLPEKATRADLVRRLAISDSEARSIILAALSGVGSILIARLGSRSSTPAP